MHDLSIEALSRRIRHRDVSPRELVDALLARIDRLNPRLHAFLDVQAEHARRRASEMEREIMSGTWRGPLHGIPYGLKDLIDFSGVRTTANSRSMANFVPGRHADVTQALENAGGIFLGKLTTNEFACGGSPVDSLHPAPLNPWNELHVTAGSSSGSAVALSAGLVPLALGSDTNGSIRNPASRCGIVGLKPTYGLVSRQGVFPLAPSADHVGPMARTVWDVACALRYMVASEAGGAAPRLDYLGSIDQGVHGLKIGVVDDLAASPSADPAVAQDMQTARDILVQGGAVATPLVFGDLEPYNAVARTLLSCEAWAIHRTRLRDNHRLYGRGTLSRILQGAFFSAEHFINAQRLREKLAARLRAMLATVDVLLLPSCLDATPRVDDAQAMHNRHLNQVHMPFNVSGHPALVLPTRVCARTGMPLSLQLVAAHHQEATLFRAARHLERQLQFSACGGPLTSLPG